MIGEKYIIVVAELSLLLFLYTQVIVHLVVILLVYELI